ncbi:MAG: hypothetical protein ACYTJ0_09870 [Planctomycetota bacterium]|jgi:hypothetical protein
MKRGRGVAAVAALVLSAGPAGLGDVVGPEWVEDDNGGGDAGSTPGGAQETVGIGQLGRIRGKLDALAALAGDGAEDLEDVFLICIEDPASFMATTELDGGFSDFDSRLYLFDAVGLGLLGNDVPPNCPPAGEAVCEGATLGNQSTDGTGVVIDQSGLYLLAVTVSPREPFSKGGPIFDFDEPDEVSGPDGPGGGLPLIAWQGGPGCPGSGDCFEPNDTPGCADPVCCELVCASDPFCCDAEWDEACASLAHKVCDGPGPLGACCFKGGSCAELDHIECGEAGGTYLGDGTSCRDVECGGGFECPGTGDCFEPNKTPGCADPKCCAAVCASDPFCCDAVWDELCAGLAAELCTVAASGVAFETASDGGVAGGGTGGDYLIVLEGACFATAVPTGACELPDGCESTTQYECRVLGGAFMGNGTACPEPDCNDNGIPDDEETAPENDPLTARAADDCGDAELICTDFFYDDDTFDAANDAITSCDLIFGGLNDVWFRYRPKSTGTAVVKVCDFDFGTVGGAPALAIVSVHTACPGTPENQVACNFASSVGTNCGAIWSAEGGQTYWIRVAGQDDTRGTFTLEVKGPRCLLNPNDINENGVPDDCECLADVDGDGFVGPADVTAVLDMLGSPCEGCPEDVNVDGVVDEGDLQIVLSSFGPCPSAP